MEAGSLAIGGTRTIEGDGEFVLLPANGGSNAYCADSAGFNATGIAALNETFGWQGVTSGGSRVVNSDGSVTWTSTHAGTAEKAPLGGLSVSTAPQNANCPIATPEFALAGGTAVGSYNIPISVTYKGGVLVNLTISNATLANGTNLNIITSASLPPSSSQFVTGTISQSGTTIATFAVDAFGNGTLTVSASGAQFVITDWHVVR